MVDDEKTIWVVCATCGLDKRNHRVLFEKNIPVYEDEPPLPPIGYVHNRLVECMGCETIKYVVSNSPYGSDDLPPWERAETDFQIYPDGSTVNQRRAALINKEDTVADDGTLLIPISVRKMYKETIEALNANIRTLAGGGLRATVEAICLDNRTLSGMKSLTQSFPAFFRVHDSLLQPEPHSSCRRWSRPQP
jgi:hypothetical protein